MITQKKPSPVDWLEQAKINWKKALQSDKIDNKYFFLILYRDCWRQGRPEWIVSIAIYPKILLVDNTNSLLKKSILKSLETSSLVSHKQKIAEFLILEYLRFFFHPLKRQ